MKKAYKMVGLVLAVLLICLCGLLAGCQEAEPTVTGIVFKSGQEPHRTYVQGQSLNLSTGVLTVVKDDTTANETLPLTAPEIMISGYDKDKLGEQTLTVSYGSVTTTFVVTVIPRLSVTGNKTDYLIGESFNTKGSLVIANDDGTTKTLPLGNSAIKVEGFDSSAVASAQVLTVTYTDKDTVYTGTFSVNIKNADKVDIKLPTTTLLYSHQQKLDLTGGQILVTFEGNQSAIKIEQSMVSGYEPELATEENMETPLEQTVTITYAGVSKSYEVEIYYSGVSLIEQCAADFTELVYDEEKGTLEPDEVFGPRAIKAMTEYYKLSEYDRELIEKEDVEKVVRHAIAYGRTQLLEIVVELGNTFRLQNNTFVWLTDGTRADAMRAYDALCDDDSDLVTLGLLLNKILEEFKETTLVEGALVGSNVPEAFSAEQLDFARELLSYILEMHDQLAEVIPIDKTDWTRDDLNSTEITAAITSIVGKVMNSEFSGYGYVPLYQMLSTWREADDYFDIVYAYYYYGNETQREMVREMFQYVPLPKLLQDIYAGIANGYSVASTISQNPEQAVWYQTEGIFAAYRQVMEGKAALEASGSDFCKELYEFLDMDTFIDNNLIFDNDNTGFKNGYEAQVQEMYGDATFEEMWSDYLAIYDLVSEDGMVHLDNPEVAAAADALFEKFINLSPSWQYSFIASMHSSYREIDRYSRGGRLVLDFTDGEAQSNFVYLFALHFEEQLTYEDGVDENGEPIVKVYETAEEITKKLFRAIEMYALRNRLNTMADFAYEMEDIELLYAEMGEAEKAAFDDVLGYVYEKYIALWRYSLSTQTTEWGTYASVVAQMQEALKVYFQMEAKVNDSTLTAEQKDPFYPLLFAAYEKAYACHEILNAIEDTNLLYAYYQDAFELSDELTCPLEHGLWKARDGYISLMLSGFFTTQDDDGNETTQRAWELYAPSGVQPFMAQAFYVMATQQAGGTFDAAKVLAVMEAYRQTAPSAKSLFYGMGCDELYFAGLKTCMGALADDVKALGEALLEAEQAYYAYLIASDANQAERLAEFRAAMEAAIALQASVTSTEAYNANLKAMYEFYLQAYNEAAAA